MNKKHKGTPASLRAIAVSAIDFIPSHYFAHHSLCDADVLMDAADVLVVPVIIATVPIIPSQDIQLNNGH